MNQLARIIALGFALTAALACNSAPGLEEGPADLVPAVSEALQHPEPEAQPAEDDWFCAEVVDTGPAEEDCDEAG